nr:immunoglobulin heavy chain junction region [Macaca mulatta]MOW45996.1 immunoglobulin heavy chain junction region [Macaca mulatta]MOW46368.1 immunoglobulin heavy chain junction region [Macaca mulatta]MOW46401.1 immunoglobulin heavy chain junction region [Macaca mulatta]MOW46631.1 immunoglobulin heavy chain junction region [Macaca mulatta]
CGRSPYFYDSGYPRVDAFDIW